MSQDDWIFIWFIDTQLEDIRATQTISQKLAEASGDNHLTRFKDIVPKPYQEFQDIFTKEVFNELPNQSLPVPFIHVLEASQECMLDRFVFMLHAQGLPSSLEFLEQWKDSVAC